MKRFFTQGLFALLLLGLVELGMAQITLRNFDPNSDKAIWFADAELPVDSGFVHGTNQFNDKAKVTAFTLPEGMDAGVVQTVRVFFGFKSSGLTTETYDIEVYNGDAETGPTDLIGGQTYNLADVEATTDLQRISFSTPTVHVLDTPLKGPLVVGQSFFVGVNYGAYGQEAWNNAAIGATDLLGVRVAEDWELWEDDSWHNISDSWLGDRDGTFGSGTDGFYMLIEVDVAETTVANEPGELPATLKLGANFPNPFRSQTTITYSLDTPGQVALTVHDVLGKEVARLVDETQAAGHHQSVFTPTDLPSGTYFYTLRTGNHHLTRALFLTR